MAREKLECAMCGAQNAFTIDPLDGSRGYCEIEDKIWVLHWNEPLTQYLIAKHKAGEQTIEVSLPILQCSGLIRSLDTVIHQLNAASINTGGYGFCPTCDGYHDWETGELLNCRHKKVGAETVH